MAHPEPSRRLIVNADDFGLSHSINEAVIRAHKEGILTTASLMVNEPAFNEAVAMAKGNPQIGVGLHLTLSHGHSTLTAKEIPGLVNEKREFSSRAAATGWRYFWRKELREQLKREVTAQFERFRATSLRLDHVNGHLHFHLHPVVFRILMEGAEGWGIRRFRLTREPFRLNMRIAQGHLMYRCRHALVYWCLSKRPKRELAARNIRHTNTVFGLLQNAGMSEPYVMRLLENLPPGDSELYSHPSLDEFRHEFDALVSARVRDTVRERGIKLIRYQDL